MNIISKERLDANAIPIRSSFGENSAVFYEYRTELLYCDGKGRVLVCSTNNKLAQMATSDINISLPPIVSSISIKYVSVVTEIMSKLISGPSVAVSDSNVNAASAVVGGQIYGVQDKLRAVTFERTIRVLDKIKEDNEINGPDAALRTGVDVVQIAKMLRMVRLKSRCIKC